MAAAVVGREPVEAPPAGPSARTHASWALIGALFGTALLVVVVIATLTANAEPYFERRSFLQIIYSFHNWGLVVYPVAAGLVSYKAPPGLKLTGVIGVLFLPVLWQLGTYVAFDDWLVKKILGIP